MTKAQTCWLLLGIFCLAYFAMAQDTVWQGYDDACKKARKQRDYAEAEKQCLAALKEAKTFGTEDVRLATTLNSLAMLYHAQGKYAEAEPLYLRALAIMEKALGPDHPNVATTLETYAALLRTMRRDSEHLNNIERYYSSTSQLIFDGSYTCSGVLINNTQNQGRPLLLTAAHCIESKEDLKSLVVIFGKRTLLKDQPYGGLEWGSIGASLLSSSREIDFALLELESTIPIYVSPIYLG